MSKNTKIRREARKEARKLVDTIAPILCREDLDLEALEEDAEREMGIPPELWGMDIGNK